MENFIFILFYFIIFFAVVEYNKQKLHFIIHLTLFLQYKNRENSFIKI